MLRTLTLLFTLTGAALAPSAVLAPYWSRKPRLTTGILSALGTGNYLMCAVLFSLGGHLLAATMIVVAGAVTLIICICTVGGRRRSARTGLPGNHSR